MSDGLLPLYLQRVPSNDPHAPNYKDRRAFDVVARKEPDGPICARWEWHASGKPRHGCKRVTLNCFVWRAEWLPDVTAYIHAGGFTKGELATLHAALGEYTRTHAPHMREPELDYARRLYARTARYIREMP